jgi:hypothetical protein
MGAVTFGSDIVHGYRAVKHTVEVTVTPNASYVTGGDDVDPAELGLSEIFDVEMLANDQGISVELDATDTKAPTLVIYDADATEVSNASDNSGRVVPLRFIGI